MKMYQEAGMHDLTIGSLFSGIGGFDLGFQREGFRTAWWVENNPDARTIMERHFPGVANYADIRDTIQDRPEELEVVDAIVGGDPCPKHSRARSSHTSTSPDLSGYFLSLVGRLRPQWVVRENVRSPTVSDFGLALELLGYGNVTVEMDAVNATGQSRARSFIVAKYQSTRKSILGYLSDTAPGPLLTRTVPGTEPLAACLTTHRTRYDSRDNYILEQYGGKWRLRIPDSEERENLAGFPRGWTDGFHPATRARLLGNSVVPAIASWLARRLASQLNDYYWAIDKVDEYITAKRFISDT